MPRISESTTLGTSSGGETPNKVRKVLCLDGGGVRGLSSIMILKYIMYLLSTDRKVNVEPWQEFDMICGTSTGGLIALMLGRMRMPIKEAEDAYLEWSKELFTPTRASYDPRQVYDFYQASGKFKSEPLEKAVREMLNDKGYGREELLQDTNENSCKVFVCAVRAENTAPVLIRSYRTRRLNSLYEHIKIWEAARATSAASTFFEPITVGGKGEKFVDGGLRYNNPIEMADLESSHLWPGDDRMIISIGTGSAPGQAIDGNMFGLARRLADIVTEADETNNRFRASHSRMVENNRLFRFTVSQGLAGIGLEEHKAVSKIAAHTETYLNDSDVIRNVEACVQTLMISGQRLGLIAPDYEDLSTHQVSDEIVKICSTCLRGQPARSTLFFCRECLVMECSECRNFHDRKHSDIKLSFIYIIWNKTMDRVKLAKACYACSRTVKSRFECTQCGRALCDFCSSSETILNTWLDGHGSEFPHHKSFISINPPTFTLPRVLERDCHCVEDQNVVSHCNRCLNCLKYGDTMYWCITCRNIYGGAIRSCRKCYLEEIPNHESHIFQNICITKPDPKAMSRSTTAGDQMTKCWQCYDCGNIIPDTNFARHPCINMSFVVGQALLDSIRINFAMCLRLAEPKWPYTEVSVSAIKCALCPTLIIYDVWSLICFTCAQMICKKCVLKSRRTHSHITFLCRIVKDHRFIQPKSDRFCRACNNDHSPGKSNGLQCIHCRKWEYCSTCLIKKRINLIPSNPNSHAHCEGKAAIWELTIPDPMVLIEGKSSVAEKIVRGIEENPKFATVSGLSLVAWAAALEKLLKNESMGKNEDERSEEDGEDAEDSEDAEYGNDIYEDEDDDSE